MYDKMNGIGAHEIIVETPDHATSWSEMPERQIRKCCGPFRTGSRISSATFASATSFYSRTTARPRARRSNIRIRS